MSSSNEDTVPLDIASDIGLEIGSRIQVKWTIIEHGEHLLQDEIYSDIEAASEDEDVIHRYRNSLETVWWSATLSRRTEETILSEDNELMPVYKLMYDALPRMGYRHRSFERAVFLSNKKLLNLSPRKVLLYRRVGESSPANSDSEDNIEVSYDEDEEASEKNKGGNKLGEIKAAEARLNYAQKAKARSSANLLRAETNLADTNVALGNARAAFSSANAAFEAALKARASSRAALGTAIDEDIEASNDLKDAKDALEVAKRDCGRNDVDQQEVGERSSKKQRSCEFDISCVVVRQPTSHMSTMTHIDW